jgi:hypothetical protein
LMEEKESKFKIKMESDRKLLRPVAREILKSRTTL